MYLKIFFGRKCTLNALQIPYLFLQEMIDTNAVVSFLDFSLSPEIIVYVIKFVNSYNHRISGLIKINYMLKWLQQQSLKYQEADYYIYFLRFLS